MSAGRDFVRELPERLNRPKPGFKAQLSMAPEPRPGQRIYTEVENSCLKAGVMLLLFPQNGDLRLPLIRRTKTVLHHRDQIGFPGGRIEGSENFEQAALRETREELGVPANLIKILGWLTPLYIPPSNYCVYPVVGLAAGRPAFSPLADEVAEVIEVPLGHLLNPSNRRKETRIIRGQPVEVPYFAFGEHKIWGATAMILAEFLSVLETPG